MDVDEAGADHKTGRGTHARLEEAVAVAGGQCRSSTVAIGGPFEVGDRLKVTNGVGALERGGGLHGGYDCYLFGARP